MDDRTRLEFSTPVALCTQVILEYPEFRSARGGLQQAAADPVVPILRQHVQRMELMAVEGDKAHQVVEVIHLSHD